MLSSVPMVAGAAAGGSARVDYAVARKQGDAAAGGDKARQRAASSFCGNLNCARLLARALGELQSQRATVFFRRF